MLPKKPRKKRPPAAYEPHECVVLAVDTARVSGWCIMLDGAYHSSGETDCLKDPSGAYLICARAIALAGDQQRKVVLVYERPFRGNTQGQYIGHWKSAFAAGGGSLRRTLGVYPSQWRARITGASNATREAARDREMRVAETIAPMTGPDEAAAVCIALFGARAGEVWKLVETKRKGAA
jgi:hypothetical protein